MPPAPQETPQPLPLGGAAGGGVGDSGAAVDGTQGSEEPKQTPACGEPAQEVDDFGLSLIKAGLSGDVHAFEVLRHFGLAEFDESGVRTSEMQPEIPLTAPLASRCCAAPCHRSSRA